MSCCFFKSLIEITLFLQGTAHTGPALTPAEVLIAIHDINPEKDKVALKKVIAFTIVVLLPCNSILTLLV